MNDQTPNVTYHIAEFVLSKLLDTYLFRPNHGGRWIVIPRHEYESFQRCLDSEPDIFASYQLAYIRGAR